MLIEEKFGNIELLYNEYTKVLKRNNDLVELLFSFLKKINENKIDYKKSKFMIFKKENDIKLFDYEILININSESDSYCPFTFSLQNFELLVYMGSFGPPFYEGTKFNNAKKLTELQSTLINYFEYPIEEVITDYVKGTAYKREFFSIQENKRLFFHGEKNYLFFPIRGKKVVDIIYYKSWIDNE